VDGRLSGGQVAVYAALGIVLLLLGVKVMRGDGAPAAPQGDGTVAIRGSGREGAGGLGGGDLVVHVAGAVREPGVYRLPTGSRVADALERAGGPKSRAVANAINLAAPLGDGQQVVVPATSPEGGSATSGGAVGAADTDGPISLGSAGAADLERIDGIGPVTAEKIIGFRDQRGGIGAIEELDAIPGIGPATIESLRSALQP
jgi:competence protein ComEA